MTTRRDFLKQTSLIAAAGVVSNQMVKAAINGSTINDSALYTLAPLPYKYEDLEPAIDTLTMQIHHDKHHGKYVSNLNDLAKDLKWEKYPPLDELMKSISKYPAGVRNNGGGHYNHSLFWNLMIPGGPKAPEGKLSDAINTTFTSFDEFKKQFSAVAASRFGSGWAWLIQNNDGKLQIGSTPNQDNPLMDISELKGTPLLALDVWEHAYYLKYQNKRADYITYWWNVVNWNEVAKRLV